MHDAPVLAVLTTLLVLRAAAPFAQQERQAQRVETESYVIDVPSGGSWKVKVDGKTAAIRLESRKPVAVIDVSPRAVDEEQSQLAEQQIAKDYRDQEVAMMMVQGALQSLYVPQDWVQDTAAVDGRKVYTLSYRTVGEGFGKPNGQAMLYLYFPPDFREKRIFYRFLMHVIVSNQEARNTVDFAPVRQVVASFRLR